MLLAWYGYDSTSYNRHIVMAQKYLQAGDYNCAILEYQTAIQANPEDEEAYAMLEDAYKENGQNAMAESTLKEGLQKTGSERLAGMIEESWGAATESFVTSSNGNNDGNDNSQDNSGSNDVISEESASDDSGEEDSEESDGKKKDENSSESEELNSEDGSENDSENNSEENIDETTDETSEEHPEDGSGVNAPLSFMVK